MMLGLMRVKDEARWIQRCVESILPACEMGVVVMDDHSTDGTPDICAAIPGVKVLHSPFEGLNETRDKCWLLDQVRPMAPEWILMTDGDEMLALGSLPRLEEAKSSSVPAWSFQVLYLWNDEHTVRMDGVYSRFWRPSMFRLSDHQFQSSGASGGFHCGNIPLAQQRQARPLSGAPLLHFGYMHREDRLRKFDWYRGIDGQNMNEDGYRHIAQGDLPELPATAVFQHAGPLVLNQLEAVYA